MKNSGIYICGLRNNEKMPITKDSRRVENCLKVNKQNVKFGQTSDLANRKRNYHNTFGASNVIFETICEVPLKDVKRAENLLKVIFKNTSIRHNAKVHEWQEGITYEELKSKVLITLKENGILVL